MVACSPNLTKSWMPFSHFPRRLVVRRVATGYVAIADGPTQVPDAPGLDTLLFTQTPLKREQLIRILLDTGWHQQDVGDALAEADAYADRYI